ncbi:fatty-acyl-CoA synthase [Tumebacillus sp. BK434]|uniref:AMP-binding protein n=1 Tax=Tumebacillus sp. BK434 TaxID=2512169 RepID=UPI0010535536|nr:AMP-binding protein [Tumebacillus sp. BK434]TCP53340.1 fatty-acyl-CoA synthase [Tumebacillus sp. BK434]
MAERLHTTVGQLLDDLAARFPARDAMVYHDRGLRYTYAEFNEVCKQAAKGLIKLGIERGEHVAAWSTNYPEWLITQFATGKMGAVLVTVNTNYRAAELEYLLRQSDTTTLILMEEFKGTSYIDMLYELVPELREAEPGQLQSERLPFLKNVIFLGDKKWPGMFNWADIMALGQDVPDAELAVRQSSLHPDDVINMQYTSGTTGFPKGVMLTHNNLVNNGRNVAECMNLSEIDRLCIPVPFFHCFGCVLGAMACVTVGAAMVPVVEFNVQAVLETVQAEKCTALHGVPTMFIAELNHPDFASYDLSSLRTGIMAGSPCPTEVMKAVIEKMGAREITITYGQTESSPAITMTRTTDGLETRVATVGRALPNVEVKIFIPGTSEEAPLGEQGEICTRGYHVMKGYYKNPEATRAAIDEDGWLHTGDLGTLDADGNLRVTGRLKDMIIRGGENVYPREVEEFLYTHPKVLDVQVIGIPDPKYGEEVGAFVIVKEGATLTAEELREYCLDKISRFKIPRYFEFVEGYPMTASGKVQKFKLRELAQEKFLLN